LVALLIANRTAKKTFHQMQFKPEVSCLSFWT